MAKSRVPIQPRLLKAFQAAVTTYCRITPLLVLWIAYLCFLYTGDHRILSLGTAGWLPTLN